MTSQKTYLVETHIDGYKIIHKQGFFYPYILMKGEEELRSFLHLADAKLYVAETLMGEKNV